MGRLLTIPAVFLACAFGFGPAPASRAQDAPPASPAVGAEEIGEAQKLLGLEFDEAERELMAKGVRENLAQYESLRKIPLPNGVPPALVFHPVPPDMKFDTTVRPFRRSPVGEVALPENRDDLAYYSVAQLHELIRTRRITSVELTRYFLERLRKYGPKLECVVTLTEDLALEQARSADREIAEGKIRGPLHGIPYGVKDLFAVPGTRTTWGAAPYRDQEIEETATVVRRLADAGAVLVAKLALGALAWGDVWFGGQTRNPWNLEQGSSGSSAGPAAATAAGLVPFALGTETWGSIVSPCTRCGVTGLRPTFGRVSRTGAMALSWSMDKIGPIARTVEDCAIVLDGIRGPDGIDPTVLDLPFNYDPAIDPAKLRIGIVKEEFDRRGGPHDAATIEVLRSLGVEPIPIELPDLPVEDLRFILNAEAAAAFDDLTRSGRDDLLVRQIEQAWPNVFRQSRFIPAVEYIEANRIRWLLIREMARRMETVDLYVTPSFGRSLLLTNLTGHPCVVIPNGRTDAGVPVSSISFIGRLFGEAETLAVARRVQEAQGLHRARPPLDE